MIPCLECGRVTDSTRCPTCERQHDRGRRPPPRQRGYDARYERNRAILLADHPLCSICRVAKATTADHVVPTSQGGTSALPNLRPACLSCNSGRGARPYH